MVSVPVVGKLDANGGGSPGGMEGGRVAGRQSRGGWWSGLRRGLMYGRRFRIINICLEWCVRSFQCKLASIMG